MRVPGGKSAATAQPFVGTTSPASFTAQAGNNQTGRVGIALQPFQVQALDLAGEGVAGEPVTFQVISGSGTLSVPQTSTDDDGTASTVLTLGASPGVVQVSASTPRVPKPVIFTVIATP